MKGQDATMTQCPTHPHPDYPNVQVEEPYDMGGTRLEVGQHILYPTRTGGWGDGAAIRRGVITAILEPKHRGYGYWTHDIQVVGPDGKKARVNYPRNTLVVIGPTQPTIVGES